MVARLDMRTARFDASADAVMIDGANVTVAVTRQALEALYAKDFTADQAVAKAVAQAGRLKRLANAIPADDGRIQITTDLLMNDGRLAPAEDENSGA